MAAEIMVFAALLAVPASAFLCPAAFLPCFALFPLAALVQLRVAYFRSLLFLSMGPVLFLLWALSAGNPSGALAALRWISAVSAGVYFSGVLGPGGIACVLGSVRGLPPVTRLSETMLLAGGAASAAGEYWKVHRDRPLKDRLTMTLTDALRCTEPSPAPRSAPGALALSVALLSWCFFLLSVSGKLG